MMIVTKELSFQILKKNENLVEMYRGMETTSTI